MLGAFKSSILTNPGPASSVFFMFFEHQEDEYSEPDLYVKVSYNETPWDLDNLEPLTFSESTEEIPGHIPLDEFRDYVDS